MMEKKENVDLTLNLKFKCASGKAGMKSYTHRPSIAKCIPIILDQRDSQGLWNSSKLTESTLAYTQRRNSLIDSIQHSQTDRYLIGDENKRFSSFQATQLQKQCRKSLAILNDGYGCKVPSLKFGRYFGSIQDATARFIARKISQNQQIKSICEKQGIQGKKIAILQETVRTIKGSPPSQTQKLLITKIQSLKNRLKVLQTQHPKLEHQNRELKQQNRRIRTNSQLYEQTLQNHQSVPHKKEKDIDIINRMNDNYRKQLKLINMCQVRVSSKSMFVTAKNNK